MSALTSLPEWKKLSELASAVKDAHMRDWFAQDANRADKMRLEACGIFLDYSKNRVNDDALKGLFDLARACKLETLRDAMFSGEQINSTEGRAVLHTALRNFSDRKVLVDGEDVMPEVHATLAKIEAFTASVHSG
ncbi:MAG: glucose-6-phosphate isomerase, partial [Pseudomonadota bacterium]|nr:glucose-6-phosphate isomerase [Pseudomonadota bacterium]